MTGQNNTSNPIAKATGLVQDGQCTTSNLVYEDGHSYNDFIPGQTYTITAEYDENDHYEGKVDVGELEILKRTTTTTLSTTTPTIEYNRNCVVNISVKDRNNNPVTTGSFTIYHSNGVIQSNCQITGESTSVNITSQIKSLADASSGNDSVLLGTYQLYVVYTDTNNVYDNSRSNNINITVNKRATQINNVTPSTNPVMVDYGGSFSVSGYVSEVTGGAHVNNGNVILSDENGMYSTLNLMVTHNTGYSFTYSPSVVHDTSNHILTLQFEGTGTTQASSHTFYYKYNKSDTHITTSNTSGYTHLNTSIPVSVQDTQNNSVQNGTLTLTIGEYSQTVNVISGLTNITIPANTFNSGTYTATLTYTAENNGIYNNSTTSLTLTLEDPVPTNVTLLDTLETTYYKGEEVTIRVLVTDDDDNPLEGLSVSAGWSRNTTSGVTDEDGIFTYNYTITTVGSRYNTFTVNVTEQLPYLACSESYSSQLSNPTTLNNVSMTASLVSATSDGVTIDVNFEDTNDANSEGFTGEVFVNYMYSGSTSYNLGSKVLTSKTLSTRIECLPYETWIAGSTYQLQVVFKPDAPRGYVYSHVMTSVYAPYRTATHLTLSVPDPLYHMDGQRLGVTLTDGDNNPIPNKNIIVRVNNADYTRSTNYDGTINGLPVSQLRPSSYPVVVSFTDENNVYANASETVTVTVQKQPTSITVDNEITVHTLDTFNIMGTLTNLVTSTTIQGATVYLKDDEGNTLSTTTTNSSGGFTFGYTPTTDPTLLHVIYEGDNNVVSGVTEDVTVSYKPYFNIYARPNKEMLYYRDGCKLLIKVTDQNDVPLPSGRNVKIKLGWLSFIITINDNLGNTSFTLNHDVGVHEYTVTVTDPQDSSITSSVSGTFTIHEIFTVSLPENIYYGEEALLGVTLEYNGTRIPNKDITIELDNPNSSYTITTDSNGYASLDVSSQSVGLHGYTVVFTDPQGVYPSYQKNGSFEVKTVNTSIVAPDFNTSPGYALNIPFHVNDEDDNPVNGGSVSVTFTKLSEAVTEYIMGKSDFAEEDEDWYYTISLTDLKLWDFNNEQDYLLTGSVMLSEHFEGDFSEPDYDYNFINHAYVIGDSSKYDLGIFQLNDVQDVYFDFVDESNEEYNLVVYSPMSAGNYQAKRIDFVFELGEEELESLLINNEQDTVTLTCNIYNDMNMTGLRTIVLCGEYTTDTANNRVDVVPELYGN